MSHGDESLLITRIGQGDRSAVEELYDRFSVPLYSMLSRMVRSDGDADAILHGVFLMVWRSAASFDCEQARVFTWLVMVARNRALDRVRSNRSEIVDSAGVNMKDAAQVEKSEFSNGEIGKSNEFPPSKCALGALSPDEKLAIERVFFDGLDPRVIARQMGESDQTITHRIRSGMEKLLIESSRADEFFDEQDREKAVLFALDVLPANERAAFLNQSRKNVELSKMIEEIRDVSAMISFAAPRCFPRSDMKEKLLREIDHEPLRSPPKKNPSTSITPHTQWEASRWIAWVLAAGFAIFSGIVWGDRKDAQRLTEEISRQRVLLAAMYERVASLDQSLVEKDKIIAEGMSNPPVTDSWQLATLVGDPDNPALGSIVWDAAMQTGQLVIRDLPSAYAGLDYQLWLVEPGDSQAVSGGIISLDKHGPTEVMFKSAHPVRKVDRFIITMEKTGGAQAPHGPVVMSGDCVP